METLDGAESGLVPEQKEKVARIFERFDEDKDGALRKVRELSSGCAEISSQLRVRRALHSSHSEVPRLERAFYHFKKQ